MRKNLKDQIIEMHALRVDEESIAVSTKASPQYVREVINSLKKKQQLEEETNRNKATADDFLSVPISEKFSNFILVAPVNKKVLEAYERMVNGKNADKLW